jgi:16S rRNA (cytosine967-C5)-methyltransferase
MAIDSRCLSIKILDKFEKEKKNLQELRNHFFLIYQLEPIVRHRVMAITNDIIRLKGRLDLLIVSISKRKIKQINLNILNILRLGFYEIIYDDNIPNYASVNSLVNITKKLISKRAGGFVNAILRNLIREKKNNVNFLNKFKTSLKWNSFPIWLQKKWKKEYGDKDFSKLISFFNRKQNNFIRLNDNSFLDETLNQLKKNNIDYELFNKNFLKLNSRTSELLKTDLFRNGVISIQDPAAGAVVDLLNLKNGDVVLDICAAPGTKSLSISDKVGERGKVLAYDNNALRIIKAKKDIKRHKKKNIYWEHKDAVFDIYPLSNKILLDVPCSGTGVIGNKPDIRWRRNSNDIFQMSILQLKILKNVSKYLKVGGCMIYSTCSLEREENWNVIEKFLKLNLNFRLDKLNAKVPSNWIDNKGCLSTLPHEHNVGGMFAAKLIRI